MGVGVSGILRPNGEFLKCNFGEHYTIADKIPQAEEYSCVVFSSRTLDEKGIDSAVYVDITVGVTHEQYEWIVSHKDDFDNVQLECFIGKILEGKIRINRSI